MLIFGAGNHHPELSHEHQRENPATVDCPGVPSSIVPTNNTMDSIDLGSFISESPITGRYFGHKSLISTY
jgi:hypothetical protein